MLMTKQAVPENSIIELSRPSFVELLNRTKHVVMARHPKPILTCVRLEMTEGLLRLDGTDGELSLHAHIPAEGALAPCVVPFDDLYRRIKASKHPTCCLSLAKDGNGLIVNGGRVEHTLQTYDQADFPVVVKCLEGDSIEIEANDLVAAIKVASRAVTKEPSRYAINGIMLESNETGSRLVATDGRRMVLVELPNTGELGGQVLLPNRFCQLITKLVDRSTESVAIAIKRCPDTENSAGQVFAAGPDWLLSTSECDATFPNYRDVVPKTHSKFALDRKTLIESLAEVALTTTLDHHLVQLDLGPDVLILSTELPEVGRSEAHLATEYLDGGDDFIRTAFNPSYLLDALKSLTGDQIIIDIDQNGVGLDRTVFGKPALIYDRHNSVTRWIIMPLSCGLEPTRENLGSNYRDHWDDETGARASLAISHTRP